MNSQTIAANRHRFVPAVPAGVMLAFLCVIPFDAFASLQTPKPASEPQAASNIAFAPMTADVVQQKLLEWLAAAKADEATNRQVTALWADRELVTALSPEELLDRVVDSLAIVDAGLKRFADDLRSGSDPAPLVFEGNRTHPFFESSVRLFHVRWLVQHRMYDEALDTLKRVNPDESIDPAAVFFYRAVAQQRLLLNAEAGESLTLLLNNTLDVPSRFRVVAEMMKKELQEREAGGLPEVSRVMSDVQRRLDLGRSGEKVQQQEDRVIALLDKLLQDMQQQQNPQQGGGGGGQGNQQNQSSQQGADQSTIKGSPGAGIADRKDLKENGAWGMLDKQAETKARELIRQQFPSNYLDAISRYTRKIAERR